MIEGLKEPWRGFGEAWRGLEDAWRTAGKKNISPQHWALPPTSSIIPIYKEGVATMTSKNTRFFDLMVAIPSVLIGMMEWRRALGNGDMMYFSLGVVGRGRWRPSECLEA